MVHHWAHVQVPAQMREHDCGFDVFGDEFADDLDQGHQTSSLESPMT
jgi:hypothetical protein